MSDAVQELAKQIVETIRADEPKRIGFGFMHRDETTLVSAVLDIEISPEDYAKLLDAHKRFAQARGDINDLYQRLTEGYEIPPMVSVRFATKYREGPTEEGIAR